MGVHELSRREARRIAVRAQLLDGAAPGGLLDVVHRLTLVQNDQTATVAPSADLVAWSRLGSSYSPAELENALTDRTLIDLRGMVRPAGDVALYRADMADWPGRGALRDWQVANAEWVKTNDACRRDLLFRLATSGPVTVRELPDTCVVPWRSTGWTNDKNVTRMLEFMVSRGEVAVAGREGRERLWDLAERVYPDDPMVPAEQAARIRNERRLRSLGIARARSAESSIEPADVADVGEPAVIEGLRGRWRVDPSYLDGVPFTGRVALLSPLDRLVFDRKRMTEIFDFDYQLEMYKPVAKRRWGYYALPILYGDDLVGKVDATADRANGVLRVDAIHEDVPFGPAMTAEIQSEIEDLADWLKLEVQLPRRRQVK
jgi:uncharacterized protein YcaQ